MALEPHVAGELARIADGHVDGGKPRGVRTCKHCNRKHGRNEPCQLFLRTRELPDGTKVKRWCT